MYSVQVFEAKARLSQLLWLTSTGQAVEITRRGVPVAWLIPAPAAGAASAGAALPVQAEPQQGEKRA